MAAQVDKVKAFLALDDALPAPAAIREANAQMGLRNVGTLPEQVAALLAALGV